LCKGRAEREGVFRSSKKGKTKESNTTKEEEGGFFKKGDCRGGEKVGGHREKPWGQRGPLQTNNP